MPSRCFHLPFPFPFPTPFSPLETAPTSPHTPLFPSGTVWVARGCQVRSAARILGDAPLFQKLEAVSAAIKRDIVFAGSLYTTS
eukprot:2524557-Prymnesium_polylepis.2